jgi:F-type H+-transporting ATPase subunit delta
MEEVARVYARSLFEVARDHDVLDRVHDELAQVADELEQSKDLRLFFFSPWFSTEEKRAGIRRIIDGADERTVRFLELLAERHRLPFVARIRRAFDELWREERRLLSVSVTSAVELDPGLVAEIGRRIEEQTGRSVELESRVDPDVLGGLVLQVGDRVLDASLRNRLERLRKQVAKAA